MLETDRQTGRQAEERKNGRRYTAAEQEMRKKKP